MTCIISLNTFLPHFPFLEMAFLLSDSCLRGLKLRGVTVHAIGGLCAFGRLEIREPCFSVILAVGGNDLSNSHSPQQVYTSLLEASQKVNLI